MTLEQAIRTSDYSTVQHVDANGFGYYVDGAGNPFYELSSCVEGQPASLIATRDTVEQIASLLPADVASSDGWEPIGEADA